MCLLTYLPPGTKPEVSTLLNGAEYNSDGHGFAIVTNRGLRVRHGLNAETTIETFAAERHRHPDGPALFHSRMATAGTITRYNCHPFWLRGDKRTVIAHNGILPKLTQPRGKDRRCDTRIAAEEVLPGYDLRTRGARDKLARWVGKANKLVFLTTNPRYDQSAYLINESAGIWDKGIWYSNHDYRLPRDTPTDQLAGLFCPRCGTTKAVTSEICTVCETCMDCARHWQDCLCYPARHTPRHSEVLTVG